MKSLLLIVGLSSILCACNPACIRPDPEVVVKYKYVISEIPGEMLVVPPKVNDLNPDTATDKEAAVWMIQSEARSSQIEKQLKAIKKYQDDKLQNLTYPAEDIIKD